MSKSIEIVRQSTVELPYLQSYKLVVSATNGENMPTKIFVKQRIRNFAHDSIDDTFVAVATPVQLEDFEEDAPGENSSYFRVDTVELVARTPELLATVFDSIMYEVKSLVLDLEALDNLAPAETFRVSGSEPITRLTNSPTISQVVRDNLTGLLTVKFNSNSVAGDPEIVNYQYSLDAGATWYTRKPESSASPILVYNIEPNVTYNLIIRAYLGGNKYGPSSPAVYVATVG